MRWTGAMCVGVGLVALGCSSERPEFGSAKDSRDASAGHGRNEKSDSGSFASGVDAAESLIDSGVDESEGTIDQTSTEESVSVQNSNATTDTQSLSETSTREATTDAPATVTSEATSDSIANVTSEDDPDGGNSEVDGATEEPCGEISQACCEDDQCSEELVCVDAVCVQPVSTASITLQTTGLKGVLIVDINGTNHTITADGETALELELAVGELLDGAIDTEPPGQRCLLNGDTSVLEQYSGQELVLILECEDDNAVLTDLVSSLPQLSFDSETVGYDLNVPFSRYIATFAATPEQDTATVRIEGQVVSPGQEVSLALPVGSRSIRVDVEAQSGREQVYTIDIRRAAQLDFVERLVPQEEENIGFGARLDLGGSQVAVLTAGSTPGSRAAITIFDFSSLSPLNHLGDLNPRDSFSPNFAFDSGHLVFTSSDYHSMTLWNADGWEEPTTAPIEWDDTSWGNAVLAKGAISGNTMVLGGISTQIIYEFDDGTWTETQRLHALEDGGYANPLFLELYGDTLVIGGTPSDDDNGMFQIYQRSDGLFELDRSLDVVPEGVAIGADVVAIGSDGSTEVYEFDGDQWRYERTLDVERPLWIAGSQLVASAGEEATVRPWGTAADTEASTVTRADTNSAATCSVLAESAAMSDLGVLIGGCNEVLVFQ